MSQIYDGPPEMPSAEPVLLENTGERWIPGVTDERIEADHRARYLFATRYSASRNCLDIACGTGLGAFTLATDGKALRVDAVDICPRTVAYARQQFSHPSIAYSVGSIEDFGTANQYDLVTCFETIEHVPDERRALRNICRVLAPGGHLLISSPNRPVTSPGCHSIEDQPANPHHVREFTPRELNQRLLAAGLVPLSTYGQRLRWQPASSRFRQLLQRLRARRRYNPDVDSTSIPRRFWISTPRYFVAIARKNR